MGVILMKLLRKNCIGCGACKSICPKKCISVKKNNDGFYTAFFNEKECINCNLCNKVCSIDKLILNKENEIYAVKNKDESVRANSSSGGIFFELSRNYIKKGYVVGAAFNKENKVEHIIVDKERDLFKFNGAKYVQSNLNNIFLKIKKLLLKGEYVLFSGTPCQCNALKMFLNYCKVNTNNLVICDVICHGVPSPLNLEKYLEYQSCINEDIIRSINFRYKNEDSIQNIKIDFNKKYYISKPRDDIYYYSFFKGYNFMPNCYRCKYTNFNRVGDISLGDFWGCDKYNNEFYDKKGISLVFINTNKGKEIFNEISSHLNYLKIEKNDCIQPSLVEPIKKPRDNDEFKLLLKNDYNRVKKFIGEKNGKNKV